MKKIKEVKSEAEKKLDEVLRAAFPMYPSLWQIMVSHRFNTEKEQVLFEDENDQDLVLSKMDKVLLHKREVA